ncbi:hypothetical protein C818_01699 [Lachnospiraceae bacterium MD308]|nr:hypothetical protein C818_01699 [Lachnospiraceae bacterium MD308]
MKLGFMKRWRYRCYKSAYLKKHRNHRFCCVCSSLREVCEILNSNINFRNK